MNGIIQDRAKVVCGIPVLCSFSEEITAWLVQWTRVRMIMVDLLNARNHGNNVLDLGIVGYLEVLEDMNSRYVNPVPIFHMNKFTIEELAGALNTKADVTHGRDYITIPLSTEKYGSVLWICKTGWHIYIPSKTSAGSTDAKVLKLSLTRLIALDKDYPLGVTVEMICGLRPEIIDCLNVLGRNVVELTFQSAPEFIIVDHMRRVSLPNLLLLGFASCGNVRLTNGCLDNFVLLRALAFRDSIPVFFEKHPDCLPSSLKVIEISEVADKNLRKNELHWLKDHFKSSPEQLEPKNAGELWEFQSDRHYSRNRAFRSDDVIVELFRGET